MRALVPPQDGHAGLVAVTEFHILKAIPPYTVPSGLTAVYGSTLDQVDPGPGFAWNTPGQTVGSAGPQVFEARFVPADTENYETVENVQVPVQVLPKDAALLWVSPVANAQDAAALTVRDLRAWRRVKAKISGCQRLTEPTQPEQMQARCLRLLAWHRG